MKKFSKSSLMASLVALGALVGMLHSSVSFAIDDVAALDRAPQKQSTKCNRGAKQSIKRAKAKAFKLGLCVGQELAQKGIKLPATQAGRKASLDPSSKGAFKDAFAACKKSLKLGKKQKKAFALAELDDDDVMVGSEE